MSILNNIKNAFEYLRLTLILPGVNWKDRKFMADLERWKTILKISGTNPSVLAHLMWNYPEYRALFIYRNRNRRLYRSWIKLWYKPMESLYLQAFDIGGGLFIQHGFATMVSAAKIGDNCWINQQVTIGYNGESNPPVIGNNVMITCGAKVLGNITIGDGAVIGANAVVVRDVEPGAIMGGIPAHRIVTDRKK